MQKNIKKHSFEAEEAQFGRLLISPALIVLALLVLYPIAYNFYLSFNKVSFTTGNVFTGLENYFNILSDKEFWISLWITLVYVFCSTMGAALLGLGVATMMNKEFPLRGLVRSILLFPYVVPVISVVFAWQFFFDPVQGPFTHFMVNVLSLYKTRFNIIGQPKSALWIAILFNIWRSFPFMYLMILSRLQAIDTNLYEAADIDGAGRWAKFRYITFPELYFVLGSLMLLRIIWNFNKFEEVFLLTDNVKVLSVFTYFKAFTGTQDIGQGSSIAVIQTVILTGIILFYVKKVLKW